MSERGPGEVGGNEGVARLTVMTLLYSRALSATHKQTHGGRSLGHRTFFLSPKKFSRVHLVANGPPPMVKAIMTHIVAVAHGVDVLEVPLVVHVHA